MVFYKQVPKVAFCELESFFIPEPNSGCWIWTGALDRMGYGRYRNFKAHRVCYTSLKSEISIALTLDHLCRNHCCINPDHLEPVTQKENINRGETGKHNAEKAKAATHCAQGHPYTEENIWVQPDGQRRRCKMCTYLRNKKWQTINHEKYLAYLREWRIKNI